MGGEEEGEENDTPWGGEGRGGWMEEEGERG
jgi:hypothetical protein